MPKAVYAETKVSEGKAAIQVNAGAVIADDMCSPLLSDDVEVEPDNSTIVPTRAYAEARYQEGFSSVRPDLRPTVLSGSVLQYLDLSHAKMSNVKLNDAFVWGDLSHANLSYADLADADLTSNLLIGANRTGAKLTRT